MKITSTLECRNREELFINIQAIQAAGRLTPEARKALIAYGDGYSTCDLCLKPFRLDYIKTPPIAEFYCELAKFVNMDVAKVVPGARRGFQAVAHSLLREGDIVLVSSLAHYTLCVAVESARAVWKEIPLNENNTVTAAATEEKIQQVKNETGQLPKLVAVDHFDYQLGNEHEVSGIARVAHSYGIPFLYNGAYTVGVMPVDGKAIGADFLTGSGHKSMASPAPTGVLATTEAFASYPFGTKDSEGDLTGRRFGIKEPHLLGCTVMGAPLIGMMASFPAVCERVQHWGEEVQKSNYFVDQFLRIEGNAIDSEMPRKHTLTKVDTTLSFGRVAKKHKRRGYFLYDALQERGIAGPFPGATNAWKLNTYGLSWSQVEYVANAFLEIAVANGLAVK